MRLFRYRDIQITRAVHQICGSMYDLLSMKIEGYPDSTMHDLPRARRKHDPSCEFFAFSITEYANFAYSNLPLI